jgi:hypothetical protein
MTKIILTYKTALYMSKEASKLPKGNMQRNILLQYVEEYNKGNVRSLVAGDNAMDYVVLNEHNDPKGNEP